MLSAVVPSVSAVLSAETVGDPESTRRVYATVLILLVLGVAMAVLAIWLFRRTRPEPQLLAPLEVMDSKRWRRSEPAQRRRELDEKRPPGARPLHRATELPRVDSEFGTAQPVRSFDDLAADPGRAEDSADVIVPEDQRPSGTDDPTPVEQDTFDFSVVDALLAAGADPEDPDGDEVTDAPLRRSTLETGETGLIGERDDVEDIDDTDDVDGTDDQVEGVVDVEDDVDVDVDVEGATDAVSEVDDDDDSEPMMPGEGLLRRTRNPSN